jgi:hypothetical protein
VSSDRGSATLWADWRLSLFIVQPDTALAWEICDLIRRMSRENPGWGAPRMHGELLKLGIEIGETSVGKYLVRSRKPPSQTWRTFLENPI